eukprot:8675032-Alexandrium_andersonii.AAC.1
MFQQPEPYWDARARWGKIVGGIAELLQMLVRLIRARLALAPLGGRTFGNLPNLPLGTYRTYKSKQVIGGYHCEGPAAPAATSRTA